MDQIAPMLAVAGEPFDSTEYSFEIKWDGVRSLAAVESPRFWRLWGRNGADYTARYPELSTLRQLPAGTLLDGEIVQLTGGRADFAALMRRHGLVSLRKIRWAAQQQPVTYVVFDLLQWQGRSLLKEPLYKRRHQLAQLLDETRPPRLTFSSGVVETGQEFFRQVVEQGHEGLMAKHLDSPYLPGKRAAAWRKIKPHEQAVCVIIGYQAAGTRIQTLLLAAQRFGELRYVGQVRAGLTEAVCRDLAPLLAGCSCRAPVVKTTQAARWVRPELYCLVQSFGWTAGGRLKFGCLRILLHAADGCAASKEDTSRH